ncbi:MAG: ketoacyl-ACP synthase III [Rhodobacteraceae bacterium]|nr:ketoacyl-ACP synthase III [Paracoccaceae bacterium]
MTELDAVIEGTGHFLPSNVIDNTHFESFLDTSDEWIQSRTGIRTRCFAAENETTSDLAIAACAEAMKNAGAGPEDIDLIVLATSTPDYTFPATATLVQNALGIRQGFAFDIQAVCSGFVFALASASSFLQTGAATRALVVGAETFSRILDWKDRSTCILFGDGAGAVVLAAQPRGKSQPRRGILASDVKSDGRYRELLYVNGGVSKTGTVGHLTMKGKEVFRHAVSKLAVSTNAALDQAGLTTSDVDWVVPHQANVRILNALMSRLGLENEKLVSTVATQGNTSAASIPLALSMANSKNLFQDGDIVVSQAIGGGFAWGTCVMRW